MSNRQLTEQMVFDIVVTHLLTQNRPSSVIDGSCVYHHPSGMKCAVGILIAESEYSHQMEGIGIAQLANWGLLPKRLVPHVDMLESLQVVHDSYDPSQWKARCQIVAEMYNLEFNHVR